MAKSCISFGKFSFNHIYILGTIICKVLNDCLFGFNTTTQEEEKTLGIFKFVPVFVKHPLIKSCYSYLSLIIGGAICYYQLRKETKKEETPQERAERKNNKNNSVILKTLIHNQKYTTSKEKIFFQLLSVSLIFFFHEEIINLLYSLGFCSLDFWTSNIFFIFIFMKLYFAVKIYKHKKLALYFILIVCSLLLIISSLFPYTAHEKGENEEEKVLTDFSVYEVIRSYSNYILVAFIIIVFLTISCGKSYALVLEKVLMELEFFSPYNIIFFTGLIGFFLIIITIFISSYIKCNDDKKYDNDVGEFVLNYCQVIKQSTIIKYGAKIDVKTYYYDNIFVFFNKLFKENDLFSILIELLVFTPLYWSIQFFQIFCELMIIFKLNPIYLLIRDNFFYGITRIVMFVNNSEDYQNYITLTQFILLESNEIISLICYSIYLELIVLNFYGLSENVRENIIERGGKESLTNSKPLPDVKNDNNEDEYSEYSNAIGINDNDNDNNNQIDIPELN